MQYAFPRHDARHSRNQEGTACPRCSSLLLRITAATAWLETYWRPPGKAERVTILLTFERAATLKNSRRQFRLLSLPLRSCARACDALMHKPGHYRSSICRGATPPSPMLELPYTI
jgi:hypothetical protein